MGRLVFQYWLKDSNTGAAASRAQPKWSGTRIAS
jgi:hypothetical protein